MAHGGDIYTKRETEIRLDYSVNINPLGPPDAVREALFSSVSAVEHYPDLRSRKLTQALSEKMGTDPNGICFGNGASELIAAVVRALSPKKVLLPIPCFTGYPHALSDVSVETVSLETAEIIRRIESDTELLILANPNNPTGKCIPEAELKEILDACEKASCYLLLDECFIDFCCGERSILHLLGAYPHLLILRAFTKSFAIPGVRLGFLLADPQMIKRIKRVLPEWNLSVFAQNAGLACLESGDYLARTKGLIKQEREYFKQSFSQEPFCTIIKIFESDVNYIMLYSTIDLYEACLREGFLIRDLSDVPGLTKGYYRIAIRTHGENEELLSVLRKAVEERV